MSDTAPEQPREDDRLPWQQILVDDIFMMIAAGLVIPTLIYIVWGLWSLSNVEIFQP